MRLTTPITRRLGLAFAFSLVALPLYLMAMQVPQTSAPAQKQATETEPINFAAKSANIAESGVAIKINLFRWSTDEERNPVTAPLDPAAQAAAAAKEQEGRGGRGNRGGERGGQRGRGGLDPDDPALADLAQGARGGREGRGGRGGRGEAEPAKPADPISTLTAALGKAPTVGYLWTNEIVGYSIKYATRIPLPDGGERIILATDRRLGGNTAGWKTATGTPTDYEFTLLEIRMDSKGSGEGKASLTSKVIFDNEAKTLALDNYSGTPAVLQGVKR